VRPSTQQFVSTVAEEKVVSVRGDPLHGVITLFSFVGVLETAYLTILKFTSSAPALCLSSGSKSFYLRRENPQFRSTCD
jgi:hypothetical protein